MSSKKNDRIAEKKLLIQLKNEYITTVGEHWRGLPVIQQSMEQDQALVDLWEAMSDDLHDDYPVYRSASAFSQSGYFKHNYLDRIALPIGSPATLSAFSAIDTTTAIQYVGAKVGSTPVASSALNSQYEIIIESQSSQRVSDELCRYFRCFDPERLSQFQDFEAAFRHAQSGTGTIRDAAFSLRNLMEQFKGQLLVAVTKEEIGKSKKKQWLCIADNLCRGAQGGIEHSALADSHENDNELHGKLSRVGKGSLTMNVSQFKGLVASTFSHLQSVINLIDESKLKAARLAKDLPVND